VRMKGEKSILGAGQPSGQGQEEGGDLVHLGHVERHLVALRRSGHRRHPTRHRRTQHFIGLHLLLDGLPLAAEHIQLPRQPRHQLLLLFDQELRADRLHLTVASVDSVDVVGVAVEQFRPRLRCREIRRRCR